MSSLQLDLIVLPFPTEQRSIARRLWRDVGSAPDLHARACGAGGVRRRHAVRRSGAAADRSRSLCIPDACFAGHGARSPGGAAADGGPVETDSRTIWRTFCENWKLSRGTPSRYWLEHELVEVFGVDLVPSGETADAIYDQIAACVADPGFRPRALLDRFNIEVISTTDSATSDLGTTRSWLPTAWASGFFRPSARQLGLSRPSDMAGRRR